MDTTGDPSYGMVIKELGDDNASVLFSGDLSYGLKENDLPKDALSDCDLFVCELYHFTAEQLLPYIKPFSGTICINHLFDHNKFKKEILDALSGYSFRALAPENNDIVEI